MTSFADRLTDNINRTNSIIVAGLDPKIADIPQFLKGNRSISATLIDYAQLAFEVFKGLVPAVKPNIAFFEQYGVEGMIAYSAILKGAREKDLLSIADAKRGDIGSTAEAYSSAFLEEGRDFSADALTINPFLGLETLEPFIGNCEKNGKGVFILVKTSNPDAKELQGSASDSSSLTAKLCRYLSQNAARLLGDSGLSGLGAVVGATHPDEAREIRSLAPYNYFIIPGFGAQGGSASDALSGFAKNANGQLVGGIVNVSRGLFGSVKDASSADDFQTKLSTTLQTLNTELNQARHVS